MSSTVEQKSRKPENTAFKQQRLRAWQPILTPRTVLPTLFIIGIIFAPLGGIFLYESSKLFELIIDYTDCLSYTSPHIVPNSPNSVSLSISDTATTSESPAYLSETKTCSIKFTLPDKIASPVFVYYQLTNFYQNHRRYVKSVSYEQLLGQAVPESSLSSSCDPLYKNSTSGLIYYPCGLIANSMFNDTISGLKLDSGNMIPLNEEVIAWKSDSAKYAKTSYSPSQIAPPPNWVKRYPGGYTKENIPDLQKDQHFQVWMRTAALPSFRKLYGRIDTSLDAQTYLVSIVMNFDATLFKGRKYLVLSTISYLGGKNPYLGLAYLSLGSICVVLGMGFTVRHLMYPRKLGDSSYLSWNQNQPLQSARNHRATRNPSSTADPAVGGS